MPELILLRHAKSSWDDADVADADRGLSTRGRKAAPRIGRLLAREGLRPELVLCSSARRTRETWALVQAELPGEVPVRFRDSLYLATPATLLAAIRRAPADVTRLMVLGHNPGMHGFACRLLAEGAAGGDGEARRRLAEKLPTAGLVVLRIEGDWRGIDWGRARLLRFTRPKDL